MKYKFLVFTTAFALTASTFCVPVKAEDKTPIHISEIDITDCVTTAIGNEAPVYNTKVTVISDNTEELAKDSKGVIPFTENWDQMKEGSTTETEGWNSTGYHVWHFDTFITGRTEKYFLESQFGVSYEGRNQYYIATDQKDVVIKVNGVQVTDSNQLQFVIDQGQTVSLMYTAPLTTALPEGSMLRMYNPNSGEHFYTSSPLEKTLDEEAGWNYEGVGWVAPKTGTPVMRMYNPVAGEHHYTTSKDEADNLVAAGWNLESDCAWYSAPAETGLPVYREYNPNAYSCNHNYTPNQEENDNLINAGWQFEGIAWYALGL
jgi:hypothetical protein